MHNISKGQQESSIPYEAEMQAKEETKDIYKALKQRNRNTYIGIYSGLMK